MRTYSVYVVKADGTEITVRKRGHNETDALSRAVERYPRCRLAWVWLSYAAKAIHIGTRGVEAFRDSQGSL